MKNMPTPCHIALVCASALVASALTPPTPRIIGGWTNCPPTCADSCVPPLGPAKTPGGQNMSEADCMQQCGPTGFGPSTCDSKNAGVSNVKTWGPSFSKNWGATAILPGKFGGSAVAPVDGDIASYPHRWVTVGGAGTSSSGWEQSAEADILAAGALGCAFDEEGGVSAATAKPWVKQMRAKHKDWTFVYVPQCGTGVDSYDPASGGCDYIAPMMYYSNGDSYPGMDLTQGSGNTADCLRQIQQAGWPESRTILTFQSFDAYHVSGHSRTGRGGVAVALRGSAGCIGCVPGKTEGEGLLKTLGKLLTEDFSVTIQYWGTANVTLRGPYAGVLGWPAQCGGPLHRCWPAMDKANLEVVVQAAGMHD